MPLQNVHILLRLFLLQSPPCYTILEKLFSNLRGSSAANRMCCYESTPREAPGRLQGPPAHDPGGLYPLPAFDRRAHRPGGPGGAPPHRGSGGPVAGHRAGVPVRRVRQRVSGEKALDDLYRGADGLSGPIHSLYVHRGRAVLVRGQREGGGQDLLRPLRAHLPLGGLQGIRLFGDL